jgi:hypothetical protein
VAARVGGEDAAGSNPGRKIFAQRDPHLTSWWSPPVTTYAGSPTFVGASSPLHFEDRSRGDPRPTGTSPIRLFVWLFSCRFVFFDYAHPFFYHVISFITKYNQNTSQNFFSPFPYSRFFVFFSPLTSLEN